MLETTPDTPYETERCLWFGCSCCPTNLCRFLPQLGSYVWSESNEGVRLNIPAQNVFDSNGRKISVKGNYPYDGNILITFESEEEYTFACRIPEWCRKYEVKLNGKMQNISCRCPEWKRTWKCGDTIELRLDMPIELVYSSTDVLADIGKAAICRGPLVYAVECLDPEEELWRYIIKDKSTLKLCTVSGLPDGTPCIAGQAMRERKRKEVLYSTDVPSFEEVDFTAVPYMLWQNRGKSVMQIWMRTAVL